MEGGGRRWKEVEGDGRRWKEVEGGGRRAEEGVMKNSGNVRGVSIMVLELATSQREGRRNEKKGMRRKVRDGVDTFKYRTFLIHCIPLLVVICRQEIQNCQHNKCTVDCCKVAPIMSAALVWREKEGKILNKNYENHNISVRRSLCLRVGIHLNRRVN